ncbi:hypothetical protein [Nitrincola tapanii]|uniref:Uncharacterized protein n=1 Tax=Nitrincola tapanii TaxID=1708751 RepID=A0A5A9W624_9GAMM|nr:hypothetical protein [Nitrincola tapanii]KAA0875904.1 hypothetical protein E1H14_04240 [Nitrincola tapanii]
MQSYLASQLESLGALYLEALERQSHPEPYVTAHALVHRQLMPSAEVLARMVAEEPKLLAARAYDLIEDPKEIEQPSVGAIIYSNIFASALEGLLVIAVKHGWLQADETGQILVAAEELDKIEPVQYTDFSLAPPVLGHQQSRLSRLFQTAEEAFVERLNSEPHQAYALALQMASEHTLLTPDELGPLLQESPILLALRQDERLDPEVLGDNPPAGLIVGLHLTQLLLQQLLDIAEEMGALALDASGEIILPESDEDNPTVH